MSRDVFMKDVKRNVYYGLELETESDYGMPERVIMVHLGWKQLTEKMEKEGLSMCPAVKEILEDEKAAGRKEGRIEGLKEAEVKRKEERTSIIKNMIREGMDYNMIRRITKCSPKEFSLAAKS